MPVIDMKDYKMIVGDKVYNVLQIAFVLEDNGEGKPKVRFIEASYIDENGMVQIMNDVASKFQFVKRI